MADKPWIDRGIINRAIARANEDLEYNQAVHTQHQHMLHVSEVECELRKLALRSTQATMLRTKGIRHEANRRIKALNGKIVQMPYETISYSQI